VHVDSKLTAATEMMTFVQRCQLLWSVELRTVVSFDSVRLG
jgi:hypothetical protein